MTPRIINVLIGTWLFFSAFAWPHSTPQGMTALVCGAMTVLLSLATMYFSGIRYLTAVVAVMLFVTSLATADHLDRTFWHNSIMAIAIFVNALIDRGTAAVKRDTEREREVYGRV
jgi:hypothetical protein